MMAKRMQEQKGEDIIVAKSKSTATNWSSHVPTSSSSATRRIGSKSPGILKARGKPESSMRRNSTSDAASSSQVRLQDAQLGGLMDTATEKLVATKEESGDVDLFRIWNLESSWRGSDEETCCFQHSYGKPYVSSKSDCEGGPKAERVEWSHNLHVSQPQSTIRKQYSRSSGGSTDENMTTLRMIWTCIWLFKGIYLNPTLRAAVHLGHNYEATLRFVKNHLWNSVGQLFNETGILISEQTKITGVNTIYFTELTWMSTS